MKLYGDPVGSAANWVADAFADWFAEDIEYFSAARRSPRARRSSAPSFKNHAARICLRPSRPTTLQKVIIQDGGFGYISDGIFRRSLLCDSLADATRADVSNFAVDAGFGVCVEGGDVVEVAAPPPEAAAFAGRAGSISADIFDGTVRATPAERGAQRTALTFWRPRRSPDWIDWRGFFANASGPDAGRYPQTSLFF